MSSTSDSTVTPYIENSGDGEREVHSRLENRIEELTSQLNSQERRIDTLERELQSIQSTATRRALQYPTQTTQSQQQATIDENDEVEQPSQSLRSSRVPLLFNSRNGHGYQAIGAEETMPKHLHGLSGQIESIRNNTCGQSIVFTGLIDDVTAHQLCLALKENTSLKSLSVDNCQGACLIRHLAQTIQQNQHNGQNHRITISKISLIGNNLEADKFIRIDMVSLFRQFTEIHLENNFISAASAQVIAQALVEGNLKIKKLWLSGNSIGDQGAMALMQAFKAVRTSLMYMDLCRNGLSESIKTQLDRLKGFSFGINHFGLREIVH